MAELMPGDPDADDRFVRLDDGDIHVAEDGDPGGPAVLLIHGTAASTAWWDPVIPQLAGDCWVIRIDMAGHGRSSAPEGGYEIPAQARRAGAVLDRLGAGQVTVIGHSTGGYVATALAGQRPGLVSALALIDTCPDLDAVMDQGLLGRLLLAPLPGRLLAQVSVASQLWSPICGEVLPGAEDGAQDMLGGIGLHAGDDCVGVRPVKVAEADGVISYLGVVRCLL